MDRQTYYIYTQGIWTHGLRTHGLRLITGLTDELLFPI